MQQENLHQNNEQSLSFENSIVYVKCKEGIYYTKKVYNPDTKRFNLLYFCYYCDEDFDKNSNVKDHLRIHTNVRPYNCEICNTAFKQ